jgi:hypothetical protein
MTIDTALIKFYPPANATDPASAEYGGGPNTAVTMTSGTLNNEWADVTNAMRVDGGTDYRKQFLYNENAEDLLGVTAWISSNTPATNDSISICQAGTLSKLGATVSLGTAEYNQTATILEFASSILFAVRPGEWVYSVTYDGSMASPREVLTVASLSLTVSSAFGSSTSGNDVIGICPATMFTYQTPTTSGDAFNIGTVPAAAGVGVWKRRTVTAGGPGYVNNAFTITFGVG